MLHGFLLTGGNGHRRFFFIFPVFRYVFRRHWREAMVPPRIPKWHWVVCSFIGGCTVVWHRVRLEILSSALFTMAQTFPTYKSIFLRVCLCSVPPCPPRHSFFSFPVCRACSLSVVSGHVYPCVGQFGVVKIWMHFINPKECPIQPYFAFP